jgi:hypothetical protein
MNGTEDWIKAWLGTGSLRVVGPSWIGSWYGPDGAEDPPQDRPRTDPWGARRSDEDPGRGALSKAARGHPAPPGRRARHHARGRRGALSATGDVRPQEVTSPHSRLRPAQPHRPLLRRPRTRPDRAEGHRALHRGEARHPRPEDRPQPPQHDALRFRDRAAPGVVHQKPRQAGRQTGYQDDRDANQVPRPTRT